MKGYSELTAHLLQGLYFPWITFQVFLANAFPMFKQQKQQPYQPFLNTIPPIDAVADNILLLPNQTKSLANIARAVILHFRNNFTGIGSRQQDKLRDGRKLKLQQAIKLNKFLTQKFPETAGLLLWIMNRKPSGHDDGGAGVVPTSLRGRNPVLSEKGLTKKTPFIYSPLRLLFSGWIKKPTRINPTNSMAIRVRAVAPKPLKKVVANAAAPWTLAKSISVFANKILRSSLNNINSSISFLRNVVNVSAETYPVNKNVIPAQIARFTLPLQSLTTYHKNSIFLHERAHLQGYSEFTAHLLQGLYFPWVTFQVFLANAFPMFKQQKQQPYQPFLNTIPPIDAVADNILLLPNQTKSLANIARAVILHFRNNFTGIGSRQQDKLRDGHKLKLQQAINMFQQMLSSQNPTNKTAIRTLSKQTRQLRMKLIMLKLWHSPDLTTLVTVALRWTTVPTRTGLETVLASVAGTEKAREIREIMEKILKPLEKLGLQSENIEVIKPLTLPSPMGTGGEALSCFSRGEGVRGESFDHTFMTFTRDINGRLKILIGEDVIREYEKAGTLEEFLKVSLIHEILESSGLTHRQVESYGFGVDSYITNGRLSMAELVKEAEEIAARNGIDLQRHVNKGKELRNDVLSELEKAMPDLKAELLKEKGLGYVIEQIGKSQDISKDNSGWVNFLSLVRLTDLFESETVSAHNDKKLSIDRAELQRLIPYMNREELADLMAKAQELYETRKGREDLGQSFAAITVQLFLNMGALEADGGNKDYKMDFAGTVFAYQKLAHLIFGREVELGEKLRDSLDELWKAGKVEADELANTAQIMHVEAYITEDYASNRVKVIDVSSLSENTVGLLLTILNKIQRNHGSVTFLYCLTGGELPPIVLLSDKEKIDVEAIRHALKTHGATPAVLETFNKVTDYGNRFLSGSETVWEQDKSGVIFDTARVYEGIQQLLRSENVPKDVDLFTEHPGRFRNLSWRDEIKLRILAIVSSTEIIDVGQTTDKSLKAIQRALQQA